MKKIKENLEWILLVVLVLVLFRTCGTGSEVTRLRKEVESQRTVLENLPTKKDIQIEGLKVEKRMIQATDRKIMDVQRQSEIEKEIDNLQGK